MVVIVDDEDDCSTTNAGLFADPAAGLASPLGPLSLFRCFEQGLECDGAADPRAFGTRTNCHPRAPSPYLAELDRYVTFLKTLKEDPSLVMVSVIAGLDDPQHTVVVGPDPQRPAYPAVQPSCYRTDPTVLGDGATPPIRLSAFAHRSVNRWTLTSICGASLTGALENLLYDGLVRYGDPCLLHPLADRNPDLPGTQAECSFTAVTHGPDDAFHDHVLPACADTDGTGRCWELLAEPTECPDTPEHLAIHVEENVADPVGGRGIVQCVVQ
ncbi:MAG TPA: hypothetical protein VHE35_35115 [Kofleriaceae bacterium]|nr:hypothetical protein [Kofleriaceae bacterium]